MSVVTLYQHDDATFDVDAADCDPLAQVVLSRFGDSLSQQTLHEFEASCQQLNVTVTRQPKRRRQRLDSDDESTPDKAATTEAVAPSFQKFNNRVHKEAKKKKSLFVQDEAEMSSDAECSTDEADDDDDDEAAKAEMADFVVDNADDDNASNGPMPMLDSDTDVDDDDGNGEEKDAVIDQLCTWTVVRRQGCLLTGEGGSGKSTVVSKLVNCWHKNKVPYALMATTGIAALRLDQAVTSMRNVFTPDVLHLDELERVSTVHSGFSLAELVYIHDPTKACAAIRAKIDRGYFIEWLRKMSGGVVVIDEISMLNDEMFDVIVGILCSAVTSGLTPPALMCVGDFYQLPPVTGRLCFLSKYWDQIVGTRVVELQTTHRFQSPAWVELLRSVRRGIYTDMVLDMLRSRVRSPTDEVPEFAAIAAPTNAYCTIINDRERNRLVQQEGAETVRLGLYSPKNHTGKIVNGKFTAWSPPEKSADADRINKIFQTLRTRGAHALKDYQDLTLCIGQQVMVTFNIDKANGIVNGTIGIITAFIKGKQSKKSSDKPPSIKVQLRLPGGATVVIAPRWHNEDDEINRLRVGTSFYPLVPATAITIYMTQGGTLDSLVVYLNDADGKPLGFGDQALMLYVALSRVRAPEHLIIVGKIDDYFIERLKSSRNTDLDRWMEQMSMHAAAVRRGREARPAINKETGRRPSIPKPRICVVQQRPSIRRLLGLVEECLHTPPAQLLHSQSS